MLSLIRRFTYPRQARTSALSPPILRLTAIREPRWLRSLIRISLPGQLSFRGTGSEHSAWSGSPSGRKP